jgi:predicted esterase
MTYKNIKLIPFLTLMITSNVFAQQMNESLFSFYYLLYVPKVKPSSGKYPLMLFLHGSGERGGDLNLVKKNGPPAFLDDSSDFPFVVVSPQCMEGQRWDPQSLLALLDHIEKQLPIDKDREYVTGLSMGGYGTWSLAIAAPDRFAAIAPICGGGDSSTVCAIRNVPAWVFHGAKDDVVPISESEVLVSELKKLGGDVAFTIYPELGHDSWTPTYKNPELYKWMLAHKRNEKPYILSKGQLSKFIGKYKYSDKDTITISLENGNLYSESSRKKRKIWIIPFAENKFRVSAKVLNNNNGERYFKINAKGEVEGLIIGPCDNTFAAKIE